MVLGGLSGGPMLWRDRLFFFMVWVVFPALISAQDFNPQIRVSSGNGTASDPAIGFDSVGNVYLVWVEGNEIQISAGVQPSEGTPITSGGFDNRHPGIVVNMMGSTTVVFQRDAEVFYTSNPGGAFNPPVNLSRSPLTDHSPLISAASPFVQRNALWIRESGAVFPTLCLAQNLGPPVAVALGADGDLASATDGRIHLVYERSGTVYYRIWDFTRFPPLSSEFPISPGSSATIAVSVGGVPRIVYSRGGEVYYVRGDGQGNFLPETNISMSPAESLRPQIVSASASVDHIFFEEDGDLWRTSGASGVFIPPERITRSPGVESSPTFGVGSFGFFHVAYVSDGEVYYTNNAVPPEPSFDLAPATGEIPLEVSFTDQSRGVVTDLHWDFGDGRTSTLTNPTHVYESVGSFTVTLTARGPGGVEVTTRTVSALPASNVIRVPDAIVFQGQPEVWIPVLGTHPDPLQGYQVALRWDCQHVFLEEMSLDNTDIAVLEPDFVAVSVVNDPVGCQLTVGIIVETSEPFEGIRVPPGTDQRLLNLVMTTSISAPAPSESRIDLRNDIGDPVILNIFTVDGLSLTPLLLDGVIRIVPFDFPGPFVFIRGDADNTTTVGLPDGLFVLSFLFTQGPAPVCLDAADFNDDGDLGLPDALGILEFLFTGGAYPPFPFPSPGLDPTRDGLGDCK